MATICQQCKKPTDGHPLCRSCLQKERALENHTEPARPGGPRAIPQNYLKEGYFFDADERHIRDSVFKEEAEAVAGVLFNTDMNKVPVEKFYRILKTINDKQRRGEDDQSVKADLNRLLTKVRLYSSRDTVPGEFFRFMERNIDYVLEKPARLRTFAEHYLSMLSYFAEYYKSKNKAKSKGRGR